jgi:hypothetical protein
MLVSFCRKMPPFAQFLRWTKILILEIPNVCLRLKFSVRLELEQN